MGDRHPKFHETRDNLQAEFQMVPAPVLDEADLVVVDTTWGEIQPMSPAAGAQTVGELELRELAADGALLVDTRNQEQFRTATLPGAVHIPFSDVLERRNELEDADQIVFFCNGPQCPQSPTAITQLVEDGFPVQQIAYYRGGMHDWVTLGLPTNPGTPAYGELSAEE
ncbi:MAG: rhodanese-like domain-containing protein [Ornithinimicrobium sp.]|uniref:rhodanese-like domain-containing protein n=1 Tax=Ornithinimicrobium sp. TaxID=1977084 RepID=UPI003D9AC901